MHPQQLESLVKAGQCAELLASDLREASRLATRDLPVLAVLLWELRGQVAAIKNRLVELEGLLKGQVHAPGTKDATETRSRAGFRTP